MPIDMTHPMKAGCICHKFDYDKIVKAIKETNPQNIREFISIHNVGRRCMMCLPYIETYINEHRAIHIKFKETQVLIVTTDSSQTITMRVTPQGIYDVEIDDYGEYADITFNHNNEKAYAYSVPTLMYDVIQR